MKTRIILALCLGGALAASAAPALAQLDPLTDPLPRTLGEPIDRRLDRVEQTLREMQAILYQGRETGQPVVVQPADTAGQMQLLTNRVSDLQDTLQRINGQIDTLSADIAAIRRDAAQDAVAARSQAQAYAALSARVDALEKAMNDQLAIAQARDEDPETAFERAMQTYTDGDMRGAANAFKTFLAVHPDDEHAPEAQYYRGEALMKQASYTEAAQAYLAAIRGWPDTSWAPDATAKLAAALVEAGRNPDACGVLDEMGRRYPKAAPSVKSQAAATRTRARCG